ncbi:uncharacterized protein Bfra_004365 [Botrytis fragariae]|uniref:Uncharacterized protein n=1 Tax=Botrytis fragariae TaxID=1964551 RepID=A0A8H6AVC7_9HELO|nr:uncharacterized protein Bfra_004365 [Botrytis fragariae]KAF5874359.1 hypothetical protein Bfra_004365 [Botrytis fragariae]
MAKHSKNQGQTASKPKQRTKKSEETSHEPTAQPSSSDDQRHEFNTIAHSEARTTPQEQIGEGVQDFDADFMMVEDRSTEIDLAPTPQEWGFDEANLLLETPEQVLQGPVNVPLSASDFDNDRNLFHHIGVHFPIPTHFETQFTGYTLPQWSWELPVTTVHRHLTTTNLDTLPATTQYQLERWVYENDHDEVTRLVVRESRSDDKVNQSEEHRRKPLNTNDVLRQSKPLDLECFLRWP